ncbi:MAG: Ig-like domain-containing protein, partial [Bryobacteraceae bacterium]
FGPNASAKYITTYFRHSFNVANPASLVSLTLRVKRDDGVVVYINGVEAWRSNMPAGAVSYTTLASTAVADDGGTWQQTSLSPSLLVAGTNVVAAEIHQSGGTSSDISFDLELTGSGAPSLTRGPYLQIGTPTSVIVRWRTDVATNSTVRYGPDPASLVSSVSDAASVTEHVITLPGLAANTKYFYSAGSSTATFAGADANHFFVTSPASGKPTRVWVIGDAGTADASQAAVRNAYYTFAGTRATDLWLMLGDNAYNNGTDSEYQAAVFNVYQNVLRHSVLWPTIGNHDTAGSSTPPANLPYFEMFSLPTAAQAGGVASGTEKYYSFNYGNIHFVCLDSMSSSRAAGSAMLTWLQNDLAANTKDWLIAYWHHPPYSKGSHDSDTDPILTEMRANVLPILEANGVDLVMAGHSHSYERSFLLDGHYGVSSTLTAAMKKDAGSGRESETGAYAKPVLGPSSHHGAVYAVAGSSGKISGGALNHPAMFISLNNLGSLVLDIDGNRLDAKFLRENGAIADSFTILKGGGAPNVPPTVSITSPAGGATYSAPASITIDATAADSDGTVTKVDFYQGTTLLGTDTTAPYSFTWSNAAAGSYSLTAKATDNANAVTTSTAVPVTVNAAPA